VLDQQGRFAEVVAILAPSLNPRHDTMNNSEIGVEWNLLGVAFENSGNYDAARHSYEDSLRVLERLPDMKKQFASALDNLASLKSDTGQFGESKRLRLRARRLYFELRDVSGEARISGNLAIIAIGERKYREADSLLQEAFSRIALVSEPDLKDLAGLYSTKALLALRETHFSEAIEAADQAIMLWSKSQGPQSYNLVPCLVIRAQALIGKKNGDAAVADLLSSLKILNEIGASQSVVYCDAELKYAQALRDVGRKTEADIEANDAKARLIAMQRSSASAQSISAQSYR